MNRDRYRTIFSKRLGTLVAVAETTKAQGKGSGSALGSGARTSRQARASQSLGGMSAVSLGVALALLGQAAFASPPLPAGGTITSGDGTISQSGNTLTVNQSSQSLAANWQSFDIDAGHSVVFNQPNSSSVALNRVIGPDASAIYGSLSANGKVFLVNPNGVLFAPGAQVSVGGLVASTLKISDEDFAAGRYRFTEGSGAGSVVNQGEITAESVALIAPKIVNSGAIRTPGGNTTLAAGDRVTVSMLNGLLTAEVDAAVVGAEIHNHGQIVATGGEVKMLAGRGDAVVDSLINIDGVVQASSIRNESGKVYLDGGAGGTVYVSGTLDVSAAEAGAHGGDVTVLGKKVELMQGARIDASGDSGGGTVLVGGNWQGSGPEHHAQTVSMSETAVIEANAINQGSGGKVVLWSDGATAFHGRIEATGVDSGGKIETSGHDLDISGGRVSTLAADGSAGEWLLDPVNVTISTSPTSSSGSAPDYSGTASGANVNVTDLLTALASNNVTISTGVAGAEAGNISVDAAINYTSTTPRTLSFISTGSGGLTGSSTIGGAGGALSVVVDQAGNSTFSGLIQGTGSITKLGAGTFTLTNQNTYSGGTTVSAGTLIGRRGGGNNVTITPFGSGSIAVAAGATAVVDNTIGTGYNHFNNEFTGAGTVSYRGSSVNRLISPATLSGFTGTVSIDQNVVQLWGANTTATLNVGGGTFAAWSTYGNPTFGALTGNGTVAGVSGGGGGTLSIGNGGGSATFSGVISNVNGQVSLTKLGTGTQTLTGNNTYSGTTTISGGTLQVGAGGTAGTLGTSAATINAAGTLRWFRSDLYFDVPNSISGTGTLSFLGTGTSLQSDYQPSGNNSGFTGTVIVDRARLQYDNANDLGTAAVINVLAGGQAYVHTGATLPNAITLNGTGWVEGSAFGALRLESGANVSGNVNLQSDTRITALNSTGTISGVISGAGNLAKTNSGTVILAGNNSYTGTTTINAGTLAVTSASGLGSTSAGTTLANGATLDLRNVALDAETITLNGNFGATVLTASTGSSSVSGNVIVNNAISSTANRVAAAAGAQLTLSGVISGVSSLTKTDAGTVVLSGNNTYTGVTNINAGTLQVGGGGVTGTLGSGAVTVASGADLIFNRSDSVSLSGLAAHAGGITGAGDVTALIGGDFNVDRAIALSGANSTILLEAGKGVPAGTVTGGDVTLSSNVSTSATGTLSIFSGNATTGAYETMVGGAEGPTRYKTYGASAGDTAGAITGTRNYYYRQQPSTLTVSGLTATKVYDGLLDASTVLDGTAAIVDGAIDGDSVAFSSLTLLGAEFDSAHAGPRTLNASFAGATPSYSGGGATWSISGYSSANATGTGTGTITPRPVSTSINAVGRDYNGLTNTTSTLAAPTGFIGNDSATGVAGLLLAFDDPNAGTRNVAASGTGVVTGFSGAARGNGSGIGAGNEVAGIASDYVVATPPPASAVITPASLIVTANDDAKIITQSDATGYNGVSFSGFVNGESAVDLGGTLAITRSNAGTESVGDYAGVLMPTGYSSSNYTISYVNGGYRILPAEQLLVRIQNISTAYGTAASYVITGAEYLDGSGTSLHALTQTARSGNTYTFSDGLGGSATFTISPDGAVLSSAGHLAVGNYALSGIDASIAGSNFSGLNYVGNHTVTPIGLTPLLGTVSKVYDGTTSMTGTTLGLTRLLAGDQVLVHATGAFHSRNVGSSVGYDISNIALSGADAGNYYLMTGALSGTDGMITPRAITLTGIGAIDRIYDGTIAASLTTAGYGFDGLVTGDAVTLDASNYSAWFGSKHVGTDKAVTVTGLTLGGVDAGNYVLTQPMGLFADVTPRPLTITAVANIKMFDGTRNAAGIPIVTGELVSGDTFTLLEQEYATANVGRGLTLTPIVGIDDGNAGANYALTLVNNTAGEIRAGIDLSQVGGSQTSARLNDDSASAENGTSADAASGVCVRGSSRNGCGEGGASGAMIQVRSTGIRLPSGLADAESTQHERPL